jgi:cellulose synthase/poly-beta-1,6-N-acetylglucosamine synthase-like glycosyltransferase
MPSLQGKAIAPSSFDALPLEIAFLAGYGVPLACLAKAASLAKTQGTSADQALLANGLVKEHLFYECLAHHLGLAFAHELLDVTVGANYAQAIEAGLVAISRPAGTLWLTAPKGGALIPLLRQRQDGMALPQRLVLTTPSNLSRSVRQAARSRIAAQASFGLLSTNADFSAMAGANRLQRCLVGLTVGLLALTLYLAPRQASGLWMIAVDLLFFAAVLFRLFVSSVALGVGRRCVASLKDHELPVYTIIVALYKEARVGRRLVAMLDRIDYPRAKLDIKLVIEEEDHATRGVLESLSLSPIYEIIVAPPGQPRTKPRALNVALPLARGEFIAVFDAEDSPDPAQLRLAAAQFAASSESVACLQARLAIDNVSDSWLTRLFAIEYATLFHLQNAGLAALDLPLPVGGSSNHFRTSVLRDVHGWDAWNVTEDADIGFRLARFGYSIEMLESVTHEEAPLSLHAWMKQRRRWFKGWLQTFITVSRNPCQLICELGPMRAGTIGLLFLSLVFGPLLWIPTSLLTIYRIVGPAPFVPATLSGVCVATLWTSVMLYGLGSIFWHALLGMKRQKLLRLWPSLVLLLPYYCLHSLAAWLAAYDLIRRPFHWHKTEHGLARSSSLPRKSLHLPRGASSLPVNPGLLKRGQRGYPGRSLATDRS